MTRPVDVFSLDDPEESSMSSINLCVYSHPGKGKTVLAGTGGKRMLIMDSDMGDGTASARAFRSKADAVAVPDYAKLDEIYQHLAHDKHGYEWCWWDSLTLFQDRTLVDEITADAHAANPNQSAWVPSQREYLIDHNRIKQYVRLFAALPINFGVSCHVTIQEDPATEEAIYMPFVQGKGMASFLAGYMNVVGFLATTKGSKPQRRILFDARNNYFAKDRFHALGVTMDAPTIAKIEDAITKAREARNTERTRPSRRTSSTTRKRTSGAQPRSSK